MVAYMKRIVELCENGDQMAADEQGGAESRNRGVEERNLISVGYKNMMSVRRTAWRTVQQYHEKNTEDGKSECAAFDDAYSGHISQEVFKLIDEVRDEIVERYVNGANKCQGEDDPEVIVFFKKMEGDYNRYGAEITENQPAKKDEYKDAAKNAYEFAQTTAKELPSTNPIRLGLALNFSVFHYEICDKKQEASQLAKEAFDTAIDHLDTLGDDEYKDSTLIMQLLKDNLTLWTTDDQGEDDLDIVDVEDN